LTDSLTSNIRSAGDFSTLHLPTNPEVGVGDLGLLDGLLDTSASVICSAVNGSS
jgi:hypothetical protein